jgi:serine/threonine protein kinase
MNINELEIINELGSGMFGTVFLVKNKRDKKYAMKITHITKDEMEKDGRVTRMLRFCKTTGKKYKKYFMQLLAHDIIDECKFEHTIPFTPASKGFQQHLKQMAKSSLCARFVFPVAEKILSMSNYYKGTRSEYISTSAQIINIINLMNSSGWVHGDIHDGNIAYEEITSQNISISGITFPSFNRRLYLFDYDTVAPIAGVSNKYIDKIKWLYRLVYFSTTKDFVPKKRLKKYSDCIKWFKQQPERKFYKQFTPIITLQYFLFTIVHTKKNQEFVYGDKKAYLPPVFEVPYYSIVYIVMNINDTRKILSELKKFV